MSAPLFCAEQIRIPPELPDILKDFTKHVIRNQPVDIISCSAEYFGRLAKQRHQANSGKKLTEIQLEAFYNKYSSNPDKKQITRKEIESACADIGVTFTQMEEIITVGGWQGDRIPWVKFWSLLVASLSGTLPATVEKICKILSDNGKILAEVAMDCVQFLADHDPDVESTSVEDTMRAIKGLQSGNHIPCQGLIDVIGKELKFVPKFDGAPTDYKARTKSAGATMEMGDDEGDDGVEEGESTEIPDVGNLHLGDDEGIPQDADMEASME